MTSPEPRTLPAARRVIAALLRLELPVAVVVLTAALASTGLALAMKPWYAAKLSLLPPFEGANIYTNLAAFIEDSDLEPIGIFTTSTSPNVYVEILKSRRMREALVRKFDLQRQYKLRRLEKALDELGRHLSVSVAPSGLVTVTVEAQDRKQAAEMANYLAIEFDRFNRHVLNTRGKSIRRFLEERIADAQRQLLTAESRLSDYERRHKVIVGPGPSPMRGFADLMGQKMNLQVRRAYVAAYTAPGSSAVRQIDAQIEAIDHELKPLPEIRSEGSRIALDAAIQRKALVLLTAQYEDARTQEVRDSPTVTVLDEARPPDNRTRPRRMIMVAAASFAAWVASMAWARLRSAGRSPERYPARDARRAGS